MPSNIFEKWKSPDQDKENVSNKPLEFSLVPLEDTWWNDERILFGSRSEYADTIQMISMAIIAKYFMLAIVKKETKNS